jgi:hypothetical protein
VHDASEPASESDRLSAPDAMLGVAVRLVDMMSS